MSSQFNVIIDNNGQVHDALPSHQKAIERIVGVNVQDVAKEMNEEEIGYFQFSFAKRTKCLMVWDREVCGRPNHLQIITLKKMKLEGKYIGAIPFENEECNIYERHNIVPSCPIYK